MDELVVEFLHKTRVDTHGMLCEDDLENDYNYYGLDDSRWTKIKSNGFRDVIPSTIKNPYKNDADVFFVICNVKAVSFIPLIARLALELGLFEEEEEEEEEERGGLLSEGNSGFNVLRNLILSDNQLYTQEHHEYVDDKYLRILVQLRKMEKEDIQRYEMLHELCNQFYHFAEKRFRFLVEWDPSTSLYPNVAMRAIPLHCAAYNYSLRGFQLVYEYGIRNNLLFKKNEHDEDDDEDEDGDTPFKIACERFGYEQVMKVIEDTLIRYSSSNNIPINLAEALLIAAIDDSIHLDCVYFLLRRHPDMLVKLQLSSTPAAVSASMARSNNNNEGDADGDGDEGNNGNCNTLVTKRILNSIKKRKRES
ncbi:hypothetical protein FRACYDRAFT_246721 [Fragilariopsis cylindrus CCMP1102]|uniref:Uncharacterized protein n=1 Tax=Fragilariopsis cylindrus CCMP1102 TaxID=635003 RepID=A0A1E7EXU5_9STRA|nr:hypothetical protein FRACYDRAFT_246721 [Fragilariopsis cylindrus CCMP1102]|eukprot:OEU10848.1 hypothetical protein FRACYDRAFT_246721 [Fragilariopsis cylindrus CCMP1102]